jgi:hypothetical protein
MDKYKLSQSTIEKLKYYVYLLIDPRNNRVFYVGKGHGNRINQHLLVALDNSVEETKKIKKIRKIKRAGRKVKLVILRHKLTEAEAFEIESSVIDLIDYLDMGSLTNDVKGHHSYDKGLATLKEIKIRYEAEDAKFDEPAILININKLYEKRMENNPLALYEATRKHWKVNINRLRRNNIKIACGAYRGIVREVFEIDKWRSSPNGRHLFEGEVASENIRRKYLDKSVAKYWKKGSQNPIKYVNA